MMHFINQAEIATNTGDAKNEMNRMRDLRSKSFGCEKDLHLSNGRNLNEKKNGNSNAKKSKLGN